MVNEFEKSLMSVIFDLNKWTKVHLESDKDFKSAFENEDFETLVEIHENEALFYQYVADSEHIEYILNE